MARPMPPPLERWKLNAREQEVLDRLTAARCSCCGTITVTVGELARGLHMSRNTAKKHLAAIYLKLGVHTREEAVSQLKET